jgi:hypothetical protein
MKLCLMCVLLGAPLSGCAAVMPVIPQIVSVVTDAMVIMGLIDSSVQEYFRTHPQIAPEVRSQYVEVYQKALRALNASQAALRGVEDLDQKKYDAAFLEFKTAYQELLDLLEKEGILRQQYLSAGPGDQIYLPTPEALSFQVSN